MTHMGAFSSAGRRAGKTARESCHWTNFNNLQQIWWRKLELKLSSLSSCIRVCICMCIYGSHWIDIHSAKYDPVNYVNPYIYDFRNKTAGNASRLNKWVHGLFHLSSDSEDIADFRSLVSKTPPPLKTPVHTWFIKSSVWRYLFSQEIHAK